MTNIVDLIESVRKNKKEDFFDKVANLCANAGEAIDPFTYQYSSKDLTLIYSAGVKEGEEREIFKISVPDKNVEYEHQLINGEIFCHTGTYEFGPVTKDIETLIEQHYNLHFED